MSSGFVMVMARVYCMLIPQKECHFKFKNRYVQYYHWDTEKSGID